jgi:glutathione S-transferase
MKLYFAPHACSLAVNIVAHELRIPLSLEPVDLRAKRLRDGSDYISVNPKGQVPTLELADGQHLTEGAVIMQYLADLRPECGMLASAGSLARYRTLEWLNFVSAELHKGFTPLFRRNTPDAYRQIARETLAARLQWLDNQLADQAFLAGPTFSIADAYCYTVLTWTKLHDIEVSSWPRLVNYIERVASRPCVKAAEREELEAL